MAQHVLTIKSISKYYKKRQVVKSVSFEIKNGEVVGLLGPNGAGKTTCFHIVAGLINANGGSVLLDQQPINHLSIDKRAKLGLSYLPQEASIFRGLSAANNIMAVLQVHRTWNKHQKRQRLDELLKKFRLTEIKDNLGSQLSGGERRRVEVARVLAMDPKFVLLDEPFAGVDPFAIADLQQMIFALRDDNIGILITDHNYRALLDTCHHSYVISDGSIIARGDKQTILQNQAVKKVYLGENTHSIA